MIRIGLIGAGEEFLRQVLPRASDGSWAGRHFEVFESGGAYDWIVVLNSGLVEPTTIVGDPGNVAYVSMEPQERRTVGRTYLDQFSRVLATDPSLQHPGLIRKTGLGWWVGTGAVTPRVRMTLDDLRTVSVPKKRNRISIVTSSKDWYPGHIARDRLIKAILRHPVSRHVDVFGRGRRAVDDKWDVIAPAKYHLSLENCALRDYWTEKISDAFLGFALPLYFGCPNIADYFPEDSFLPLDAYQTRSAIEVIEQVLDEDVWTTRLPAVLEARRRVLDIHHPLTVIAMACSRPAVRQEPFTLLPPNHFRPNRLELGWWRIKWQVYTRTRRFRFGGWPLWRGLP
jgi:hypothetical protein